MTTERNDFFKLAGKFVTIVGDDVRVGQVAPGFVSTAQDWSTVNPLQDSMGKVVILCAVPSLDTSVCDRETRRFNVDVSGMSEDIHVYVISTDLPVTQKRWCGGAGIDQVLVVSDALKRDFGKKYGCLIKETGFLRRAVFVVDRKGFIVYSAYMPELGNEPDYAAVLSAARKALA